MNELIIIDDKNPIDIFGKDGGLDPVIDKIKEKVKSEVYDASTDEGRKRIGSVARQIGSAKKTMEKMALGLTEDWRAQTARVNAEKKRMVDELDALRDEIKAPLDEFNEREKRRVEDHEQAISAIKEAVHFAMFDENGHPSSAELILQKVLDVEKIFKNRDWQEFSKRAEDQYRSTHQTLTAAHEARIKHEEEQAELERLRREEEERKAQAERERIAREAAEQARKEAEEKAEREKAEAAAKAKAEQDRVEREKAEAEARAKAAEQARIDAEEKAKRDAEEAVKRERERAEAEQRAKDEDQARREADQKHRAKINNEALKGLIEAGLSEEAGKSVIEAIVKGKIPHVKISY